MKTPKLLTWQMWMLFNWKQTK